MSTTMLNRGVYDAREAALLLGRSVDELVRWSAPDRNELGPVVPPSFDRAFSFADLVSLRVAVALRDAGVSEGDLRRGVAELSSHFQVDRPLARREVIALLATSGASFLAELEGEWYDLGRRQQGVFQDIVRVYLRRIEFDAHGEPDVWRPADRVVLDPRVQAGAPCLVGTRIPTSAIAELYESESLEDLALDFDVSLEDIEAALAFQHQVDSGHGLAA